MEILIPVWPEVRDAALAATGLQSIQGVEVAFVDDHLDPELADALEDELSRSHGAVVRRFIKQHGNAASPKAVIEEAAKCRVAVVGIAMCGSCTGATVQDAVALEKMGVHTVTVVWDTFEKAARSSARLMGLPGIEFAVIPSRKGADTADDQRAKARAATAPLVKQLLAN